MPAPGLARKCGPAFGATRSGGARQERARERRWRRKREVARLAPAVVEGRGQVGPELRLNLR